MLETSADDIADDSDFFADGGDSLLAAELVASISDAVRADVGIAVLFLDASFAGLVRATTDAHTQNLAEH
ncbi:phosphopantetheine-binding protein [Streptomyces sp. NPDC004296]|uniref:phosphopantetheine-binding protein n=1 Tax=Streptomyces sp. NPDC004296 TaxID=3364697 RepID=UPI0036B2E0FF